MTKQEVSEQTSTSQEAYVKLRTDILFNTVWTFLLNSRFSLFERICPEIVSYDYQKIMYICCKWQMEYFYD